MYGSPSAKYVVFTQAIVLKDGLEGLLGRFG
jgi:hypothetical protein